MPRPVPRPILVALLAVGITTASRAQEWQRLVVDLGVPERSEAAERALLELGPRAIDALAAVLAEPIATDADRERIRAVVRVADLLGESASTLAPALDEAMDQSLQRTNTLVLAALASLAPYGKGREWHEHFHKRIHETEDKAAAYTAFCRFAARSNQQVPADFAAAQKLLADDEVFVRELAAEAFLRLRDPAALDLLRTRLLARERPPVGHDGMRHNGFVVPLRDRFALRAAQAMVGIAPTDPKCAIAWAVLAVEHPHATVRLEALRTLAGFGPEAACAAPELVELATSTDAAVAAEALKVLGMAGDAAAPHAAKLLPLADREGTTGKLAKSLLGRLRASGAVPADLVADDPQQLARERSAMLASAEAIDRPGEAETAEAKLRAAPDLALAVLSDRLQRDRAKVGDRAVRLLAELGSGRTSAERQTLRFAFANLGHENWHAPMMSSSSGAEEGAFRPAHAEACGRLALGTANLSELVTAVSADDPTLRLGAARLLATHAGPLAATTEAAAAWRASLLVALAAPPKTTLKLPQHPTSETEVECDLGPALRTALAIALRECDLPPETAKGLFTHALASNDDPEFVAAAVRRFGPNATAEAVAKATTDPRPAVASAATAVQVARSPGK